MWNIGFEGCPKGKTTHLQAYHVNCDGWKFHSTSACLAGLNVMVCSIYIC